MLSYALNRWQTLVVILVASLGVAGTVAFLNGSLGLILFWVGFGVVGTGAMVIISFRDAQSVDEALLTQADLSQLHDRLLREKVARAEAYQRAIRQAVREIDSPELRESIDLITREDTDPVALIFTLAKRLEAYAEDNLLQQDLRRLTAGKAALNQAQQEQLANLNELRRLMGETALAIDSALAQLGSSYSAVQLARAGGELKSASASAALADLKMQSEQLRDLNASLDEVYAERRRGGT